MSTHDPALIARAVAELSSGVTDDSGLAEVGSVLASKAGMPPHAFIRHVEAALEKHRHVKFVSLSVPTSLSSEREASLKKAIESICKKTVQLSVTTDATLLGGAVLRIGDELFDSSIKSEIDSVVRILLQPLDH